MVVFFRPIEIKIVAWNPTIKSDKMFQFNEVYGGDNDLKLSHQILPEINLMILRKIMPGTSLDWNI